MAFNSTLWSLPREFQLVLPLSPWPTLPARPNENGCPPEKALRKRGKMKISQF